MSESYSQDRSTQILESDDIMRAIITVSVPMMLSGFVDALYSMVDSIFVGRFVGQLALAALAVNMVLHMVFFSVGSLFAVGVTSIISRALGAKNYQKVEVTLVNGLILSCVSLVIISFVMLIFLDPILLFMGSSEDVLHYSREYGRVILWGGFVIPLNGILMGMLRTKGLGNEVLKCAFTGAITNIVLDAIFIIWFGWGVSGAAWATLIAQLIVLRIAFRKVFSEYRIHFRLHYLKQLTWSLVSEIFSIGTPNLLRMSMFTIMGIMANRALANHGSNAVAALGIINRILHLAYQPIFASNLGTQALIGYNYGANRFLKVKTIILKGYSFATMLGLIPTLILLTAPAAMFELFTNDPEILTYTKTAARIIGSTFFLYGFQIFSTGSLLAMGHPREALILSILRPAIMLGVMYILPKLFGVLGVWSAFPTTDILSSVVIAFIMFFELHKLKLREDRLRQAI